MVGTGIAASFGVLIKGGDVLERINNITTVVFDKTGTLTAGTPSVTDLIDVVEKFKPKMPFALNESNADNQENKLSYVDNLAILYLCESSSEHPLAKAILKKVLAIHPEAGSPASKFKLIDFKNINGEGVRVNVTTAEEGKDLKVLCGNDKLMDRYGVDLEFNNFKLNMESLEREGKTVVCMAVNNIPRLLISLEEAHLAKTEALAVVTYMRDVMGLKVAMITGDNKHAAMKVAQFLDIPKANVTYRAYPNDKKKVVAGFQAQGEKVMFVGDGVNDSPVLAQADVGVAINSASDITVQAAGIVVMKDRLDDVLNAILISKKTFNRIKINFGWAFIYNIILVPIAMGILYPVSAESPSISSEHQIGEGQH